MQFLKVQKIHFPFMFLIFQLPVLIAIFFHAGFVNLATVSRYLPTAGLEWALRRFQVLAGRGLLGNIIWPAEHVLLGSNMSFQLFIYA